MTINELIAKIKKDNPEYAEIIDVYDDRSNGDARRYFHTDYCQPLLDDEYTGREEVIDYLLADEDELNHTIYANTSCYAEEGEQRLLILINKE